MKITEYTGYVFKYFKNFFLGLLVLSFIYVSFTNFLIARTNYINKNYTNNAGYNYTKQYKEVEYFLGSRLNIIDTYNRAQIGILYGSTNVKLLIKGGLGKTFDYDLNPPQYAYAGALKIGIALEYPTYFKRDDYNEFFSIGPTFDFAPTFSSVDSKLNISIFEFGAGLKLAYFFDDTYGITFIPCHFTINTILWKKGIGVEWNFGFSYDSYFGIVFRF